MRTLIDAARALYTTLVNMFRPPVTVEFPKVVRERPEGGEGTCRCPLASG